MEVTTDVPSAKGPKINGFTGKCGKCGEEVDEVMLPSFWCTDCVHKDAMKKLHQGWIK